MIDDPNRTSLAAVFHAAGTPLQLREFPLPSPQSGEALVRIECCTVCGSDLHTITGARREAVPSILGHETIGRITAVGDPPPSDLDGNPLQPGDRVTWSNCVSCGRCDRCQNRLPQKCRSLSKYGHDVAEGRSALSGGFAESMLLREGTAVVKIDSEIPAEVVCPANCATATVVAAYRSAGQIEGRRLLIFGAGLLGLTASAFAHSHGASRITVCDQDENRLRLAERFGATDTVRWDADHDVFRKNLSRDESPALYDMVLELSGSPDAVEAACPLADVGAKIVLVGSVMKSRPVHIDPERIVRQWLCIHGVHNYAPDDLRGAIDFLCRHHRDYPFSEAVQQTWPLSEVNDAIQTALADRPLRVAIRP